MAARDFLNDGYITVDQTLHEGTDIHRMLDQHRIIWASPVESDRFHPAGAQLDQIDEQRRQRLFELYPDI